MQFQNLSEIKQPKLNVLVYAPPGHGKTRFSGTVAKVANPLILSAESGLLSLRKLSREINHDFRFKAITKFTDIEDAYKYLAFKNTEKFDAVVMDSVTEIQKVCMEAILAEEKRDRAQMQDWGTLNQRMVAMIRGFRDLDLHFLATALDDWTKDEETGQMIHMPALQGQLQKTIAGYFDEVFYLHAASTKDKDGKEVTKRWLQTAGNARYIAKDRSGMLPEAAAADFAWIYERILGDKPKEQPKEA
jgi:hypothetical protein